MKRSLFAKHLKQTVLAVSASSLMLGASQAGTTVGLSFQAWYYDSGTTPQTVGYGRGYCTTGFPVTAAAFGVPAANWFNTDPLPCNGAISGDATFGGVDTTFAGGLTASLTANNAWISGIGEQVPGHAGPETVPPGNDEATWGYLDDAGGSSPVVSVSGLAAQYPNGYLLQTIAAENGVTTFDAVDINDGTTDSPVDYSLHTYFVTGSASDGWGYGSGTVGVSTPSAKLTGNTVTITCQPRTTGSRSTLAGFIITDKPVVNFDPVGVTNTAGATFTLSPYAIGLTNGLHYQWQKNDADIPGANSLTYTNPAPTTADSGSYTLVVTNLYGSATSGVAVVSILPSGIWVWKGNISGIWDIATTANWTMNGGATTYADGDTVQFDDTATTANVNVAAPVSPYEMIVTNNTQSYTISGSPIGGGAGLTKSGTNALTLSGANTFAGNITVNAGTLTIGGPGQLGGGAYAGSIINDGGLIYNSTVDQTLSGVISGTGSLTQNGNNMLTLSGANTFSGGVTANGGTLIIGTGGQLKNASGITINNGGTVQFSGSVNSDNIGSGSMPITVNSGGTLAVTTGNSMGYDNLNNYANITLNNGTFALSAVQYIGTLTLNGGTVEGTAALQFWYSVPTAISCVHDATISSPINLNNSPQTISVASGATLAVSGAIGANAFTKTGTGTIQVNGAVASAVTVAGGTLEGNGSLNNNVTIQSGSTLAVDATNIGTLYIYGTLTLAPGSTNFMKIDKTGGFMSSDQLNGMSSATLGGTLIVTNITSDTSKLAAGDTFTLLAAGAYNQNFASVILPVLPTGLSWDISGLATSGSLVVSSSAAPPVFNPPAGGYPGATTVTISSLTPGATIYYTTNGSTPTTSSPHGVTPVTVTVLVNALNETLTAYASAPGYADSGMASATYNSSLTVWTNTASGLWSDTGNWLYNLVANGSGITADFSTLTLSGDTTVTLDTSATVGYLRFADRGNAHNWILADGGVGPLTLDAGASTPVITVSNQTTTIGAALAGTGGLTKAGNGTLTLSGANTYTGPTTVSAGTVSLLNTFNTYLDSPLVIATGAVASSYATLNLNVNQNGGAPSVNVSGGGTLRLASTTNSASSPDLSFGPDQAANDYWGVREAAPLDLGSRQRFIYGLTGHNGVGEYGQAGSDAQFGGSISGSGGLTFIAQNNWTGSNPMEVPFCLMASNSFSGPVEIQRGSVYLGNTNALTQTNVLYLNATGTNNARFFLYGNSVTVANLSSSSGGTNVIANGNKLTGATLTLGAATLMVSQNTPGTYWGSIRDVQAEYDGSGSGTTGPLSLSKTGNGALTLSGTNTYSGNTIVGAGPLIVNGAIGASTVTVASGATLSGTGTIGGATTIQSGGTLAPGNNGLGTLTISNALTLAAGSTTTLAIDRTSGTSSYGKVAGLTAATFGGTLTVTSLGGTFQNGDSFQLFNIGSASNFAATTLPDISPLRWSWNPAAGTLSVASGVNTTPTNITAVVSSGNLNLSWPTDYVGWRLLMQTNHLAAGISSNPNDWGYVSGSSTTNQVSIPIDTAKPTEFYRLVYP
jgi:autotransporter-associated beta strand protein